MARKLLLQTHSEQIAEYSGEQFELVMAQTARENTLKEELGLLPSVEESEAPVAEVEDDDEESEPTKTEPAGRKQVLR
jgi:hypothetical protein